MPGNERRPERQPGAAETFGGVVTKVQPTTDLLADIDALAEHLRGHLVVQVDVDDDGHRRTYLYRSAGAAERCVLRAKGRGRMAHVSLAQLYPVGVIVGLGDAR